jgi:hypothetical protein
MPVEAFVIDSGATVHVSTAVAERRAHRRLRASELRGLKAARVKYGQDVTVIDLSPGGVLFETADVLQPNSIIVLEFTGRTKTAVVPARLLRCRHIGTAVQHRYEAACTFRRPMTLDDFVANEKPSSTPNAPAAWQRVVARFRDGRLMNGYTNDFHPSKPYLNLSTAPANDDARFTQVAHLEALYFPRGANDTPSAMHGRKIEVTLPNGDVIVGSTLNYRRDGTGFFVHPSASESDHSRVFVTPSGIRHVRFLLNAA